MILRFVKEWRSKRHLKKHEGERKELVERILELEQIKRSAQEELQELEYHEKLWNSVQLDDHRPRQRASLLGLPSHRRR